MCSSPGARVAGGGGVALVLAGRRYRLEFDFGQRLFAERLGGICRSVWNTGLVQRRAYRRRGAFHRL
ncbi:helix-turn-helix domain-containing protein [Nonomuraea sp. 10N515B]|uniref:helix-turn-helix domain-containing protein n=1 Tax=Nonomuraea sp. 10N515B TaxID=3457422 RepID=UPI003FCE076A